MGVPPWALTVTDGLALLGSGISSGISLGSEVRPLAPVRRLPQMPNRIPASLLATAMIRLSLVACTRERTAPVVVTMARGTEPFWNVEVRTDRVRFSRLGADSVIYPYAPPTMDADGRFVYRTKRFGVDPLLTLVIERGECSDGMSDQRYPGSALLTRGDSTWRGCVTTVPDTLAAGTDGP